MSATPAKPARPRSAGPPLADQDQRALIRGALGDTLFVEAAAGTGKTTELVERMVAILEAGGGQLDRMVAVTFTDAAAGELKLRLRGAIEVARLDKSRLPEARGRLDAALPKLEEARIGTIHSFCADILRERPVESGVDPRFEVAADDVARPLFDRAFARWFEGQLAAPEPGVRRILRRWKREPMFVPRRRSDEGPRAMLRQAAWQLVQERDFSTPWRHDPGFDRDRRIDALLEELEALAGWASRGDSGEWFTKSLIEIGKFVDEVRRAERVRDRDHDALEARLTDLVRAKNRFWTWKGWGKSTEEFPREKLRRQRDELYLRIKTFAEDAGADLAPRLRDELWPVVQAYEAAKERTGCLDFDDLLIRARNVVRDHPEVRRELQRRFTHYFVDEFQDTDPLQVEILALLASSDPEATDWRRAPTEAGKLFLVGDPKQSIYRFRGADLALYRELQRILVDQGAKLVRLTVSFRSVPAIQEAVNAAFAPRMGGPAERPGDAYVPLAPFRPGHEAQPALVALPVPAPFADYGKIVEYRIEESLPDAIAAWIDWLVRKSGWTVTERERPGERVPVEPRHVCILFKRFKFFGGDMTRRYVDALEARGLPHVLVGGSSFHEREEVEALRNALAAIERPGDDLAVFATLHGPLLALSDASLLTWRERAGSLNPLHARPEGLPPSLTEVAEALDLLRDLHRGRNSRPVADTIRHLLEATRAHAAFAIWPTGSQALANVHRVMDLARRAERHGLISFRAFVDRLEDDAERGEVAEAPLLEEGVEGVRIMTVHKAKGLEFPIVVLGDLTAKETPEQPLRWTDPARGLCVQRLAGCAPPELREHGDEEMALEREEALRVLYVAATRARDGLVVPVVGDERRDGWLAALHPVFYPNPARIRQPLGPTAPGCPSFGEDSVAVRPDNASRVGSVRPGLHEPQAGRSPVVWWDPLALELNVRPTIGLSQTQILKADDEERATAALAAHEAWKRARAEARTRGETATREVAAATEWLGSPDAEVPGAAAVEIADARRPGARPKGPRFGTLVHAVLATAGLDEDRERIAGHAALQARILGATQEERDAAADVVAAALQHPLLRRAAEAARDGRCRREAPLVVRLDDGTLIDAVADVAFAEDGAWTVLDFKTDAELGAREEGYRRQVALYARGIEEASGAAARGYLVRI